MRNFRGGIRDKIIVAGPGYAPFRRRDAGCFKIDGGMADQKQQVTQRPMKSTNIVLLSCDR